jgi:hypothetical protein
MPIEVKYIEESKVSAQEIKTISKIYEVCLSTWIQFLRQKDLLTGEKCSECLSNEMLSIFTRELFYKDLGLTEPLQHVRLFY